MLQNLSFGGSNHEWNLYGHLGRRCRVSYLSISLGRSPSRQEKQENATTSATAKEQEKQVTALTQASERRSAQRESSVR